MLNANKQRKLKKLLKEEVHGPEKIARILGIAENTVKAWEKKFQAMAANLPLPRVGRPLSEAQIFLQDHKDEIHSLFFEAQGNAAVAVHWLEDDYGIVIPQRMFNRFIKQVREGFNVEHKQARQSFESPPGSQMQIDFAEVELEINGKTMKIKFFIAVMSFSRRIFVKVYERETQEAWFNGIESALHYFGGSPSFIVCDNAKSLVESHEPGKPAAYNPKFLRLCEEYGIEPYATRVRDPQSKGKVERAVRYVKENGLPMVSREAITSLDELTNRLQKWCRNYADRRILSRFKESPEERWKRELGCLKELPKTLMYPVLKCTRKVDVNGFIRLENKLYRVPDAYRKREVQLELTGNIIIVKYADEIIDQLDKTQHAYSPRTMDLSITKKRKTFEQKLEERSSNPEWVRYNASVNPLQRSTESYGEVFKAKDAD